MHSADGRQRAARSACASFEVVSFEAFVDMGIIVVLDDISANGAARFIERFILAEERVHGAPWKKYTTH